MNQNNKLKNLIKKYLIRNKKILIKNNKNNNQIYNYNKIYKKKFKKINIYSKKFTISLTKVNHYKQKQMN